MLGSGRGYLSVSGRTKIRKPFKIAILAFEKTGTESQGEVVSPKIV
jgi:hypothetical protein